MICESAEVVIGKDSGPVVRLTRDHELLDESAGIFGYENPAIAVSQIPSERALAAALRADDGYFVEFKIQNLKFKD